MFQMSEMLSTKNLGSLQLVKFVFTFFLCCLFVCLFGTPILRNLVNFLLRSFYETFFLQLGTQSMPLNKIKTPRQRFSLVVAMYHVTSVFRLQIINFSY